jgi:HTH domain
MPKAKRLLELMMTVNRKRKFTVKELAEEFGVSTRTILRDLQELSELGVPLYSEVGPHGGYHVLNERSLPPISFTEEEAIAIFFSVYALRHYLSIPFEAEISSALNKFTSYMTSDIRDRIEQMKNRVDFITPVRRGKVLIYPDCSKEPFTSKCFWLSMRRRKGKLAGTSNRLAFMRETAYGIAPPIVFGVVGIACSDVIGSSRLHRHLQM